MTRVTPCCEARPPMVTVSGTIPEGMKPPGTRTLTSTIPASPAASVVSTTSAGAPAIWAPTSSTGFGPEISATWPVMPCGIVCPSPVPEERYKAASRRRVHQSIELTVFVECVGLACPFPA